MVAIDTSSLIAYLAGDEAKDTQLVDITLSDRSAVLPPVVLSELLSDPKLSADVTEAVAALPLLELSDGYWERAGRLRAKVLAKRKKTRLADTLIAQACLDHDVPLVTRDKDFARFARIAELKLLG